jgi:hypothetical protein
MDTINPVVFPLASKPCDVPKKVTPKVGGTNCCHGISDSVSKEVILSSLIIPYWQWEKAWLLWIASDTNLYLNWLYGHYLQRTVTFLVVWKLQLFSLLKIRLIID